MAFSLVIHRHFILVACIAFLLQRNLAIDCNSDTGVPSYYRECDSENDGCFGLYGLGDPYCDLEENLCKCSAPYNTETCLPDTFGCTICNFDPVSNQEPGNPSGSGSYSNNNYGCVNEVIKDYSDIEVRMIGVYESSEGVHGHGETRQSGEITLYLENCNGGGVEDFEHRIIIYLGSYEPVDWIITSNDNVVRNNLKLYQVYVASYYTSSVTLSSLDTPEMGIVDAGQYPARGDGEDSGGGDTPAMIENVYTLWGTEPYSFIGTYRTNAVTVCVGGEFANATTYTYNGTYDRDNQTPQSGTGNTNNSKNKNSNSDETLAISLGVILPIVVLTIFIIYIYLRRRKSKLSNQIANVQTKANSGETNNVTHDQLEGNTNGIGVSMQSNIMTSEGYGEQNGEGEVHTHN